MKYGDLIVLNKGTPHKDFLGYGGTLFIKDTFAIFLGFEFWNSMKFYKFVNIANNMSFLYISSTDMICRHRWLG